ncbi:MAG TPA: hypothetical protein VLG50_05810 [Candidatus Saccharimonadales bacterium]|nr:hypothetical protein [Candidatus Saccharimonadales bacterium]
MSFQDEITEAFANNGSTTEWVEVNTQRRWAYNMQTFNYQLKRRTAEDIVKHILCVVKSNHYVVMLHEMPRECVDGGASLYVLYFDPQV